MVQGRYYCNRAILLNVNRRHGLACYMQNYLLIRDKFRCVAIDCHRGRYAVRNVLRCSVRILLINGYGGKMTLTVERFAGDCANRGIGLIGSLCCSGSLPHKRRRYYKNGS